MREREKISHLKKFFLLYFSAESFLSDVKANLGSISQKIKWLHKFQLVDNYKPMPGLDGCHYLGQLIC